MNRMNTKIIIAVTNRLSAAPDSDEKTDLIEEVSENLFQRYEDLVAEGAVEREAFEQAMESLGDVEELLAYLEDVTGERIRETAAEKRFEIAEDAENAENTEAGEDAETIEDRTEKFEYTGRQNIDFGGLGRELGKELGELVEKAVAGAQDAANYARNKARDIQWDVFVSNEKKAECMTEQIPAEGISGLDVTLVNGDIEIHLAEDEDEDIILAGDIARIETRVAEDGILSIRQGNTASSSFLFMRGWDSTDISITLPKRCWESIRVESVSGDIDCHELVEVKQLAVRSSSGDICIRARAGHTELATISGDIAYMGAVNQIICSSSSGDVKVESENLPENVKIDVKAGDCNLKIPEGEGFMLNYRTISGELHSNMSLVGKFGERSGRAMYLDGGSREFSISSISGDICIEKESKSSAQ